MLGSFSKEGNVSNPIVSTRPSLNRLTDLKKLWKKTCRLAYVVHVATRFENVAPEKFRIQITNIRVNCWVLIYLNLGLALVAEA